MVGISSDQANFDDGIAPVVDSLPSNLKVDAEHCELPSDSFSKIFGAFRRQYAGVVKEYKGKQVHHTRTEWRKIKDENARKRSAKRINRERKYF